MSRFLDTVAWAVVVLFWTLFFGLLACGLFGAFGWGGVAVVSVMALVAWAMSRVWS